MNNFKTLNKLFGWATFFISLVVYLMTLEPSVSLWDCGEFISASYRLQVVHPPGAPFFLMLGRMFSLFASSPENVGFAVNCLSAFSSAGTVLFTFWITTHFANKIVDETRENRNLLILGSGLVAALTLTFMDSFWFSAVEAEVYALSSFFTALTFWALLKWKSAGESNSSDRWLVFIGFITGLALGTHMLNLLVIPAIGVAYYLRSKEFTWKGLSIALLISLVALGMVMKVIYPGIPWLLAYMDLFFVNSLGLPFFSGQVFALILVFGGIAYTLWYSHKHHKRLLNLIGLIVGFIVVGYSSYAMVVIRSLANPAIDMNNPEDPFKFYGYITREQYGDRPLVKGPYFNAPLIATEPNGTRYYKGADKYEEGGEKIEPIYDEAYMTIFPRMGIPGKSIDTRGYRMWSGMGEIQDEIDQLRSRGGMNQTDQARVQELEAEIPRFSNNLRYFFSYQIAHMYIRYFMWNFVGRFNDQQASTGNTQFDGNWYSGIRPIDNMVVGPQKTLPDYYKNQKAKNAYYFLPLLLGLLGAWVHFEKKKKDAWIVLTLFLFTGILINVYMNQPPYEPRERDYSLVGSFQTFCIWVGLGVLALADLLQKRLGKSAAMVSLAASVVLVPVNMGYQNWDDHDRSERYIGIDLAKNFLGSLDYGAVLFCNGDNDTYPLWYAQNVEGFRTDVRIINMSLLPTEWYSSVLLDKVYESDPLPLTLTKNDLQTGVFDSYIEVGGTPNQWKEMGSIVKEVVENRKKTSQEFWTSKYMYIKVDKEAIRKAKVVQDKDMDEVVDSIKITVPGNSLNKGDMVLYDLIATNARNGWKRPIYFTSVSGYDFGGLNNYLQLEGLVYRFVPINGGTDRGMPTKVADIRLASNLMKYKYYGMKEKKNFFLDDKAAYVPNDIQQMALNLCRTYYGQIRRYENIKAQIDSGKAVQLPGITDTKAWLATEADSLEVYKKRGIAVLKKLIDEMPPHVMHTRKEYKADMGIQLYNLGDKTAGLKLMDEAAEENRQFISYFSRMNERFAEELVYYAKGSMNDLISFCKQQKLDAQAQKYERMVREASQGQ